MFPPDAACSCRENKLLSPTIEVARALAAETLRLERTPSDLVNQAHAVTPAEIDLLWKTAPPRLPIARPKTT